MKYVAFDVVNGDLARRIVVAFPNEVVHADMAEGVEHALRLSCPKSEVRLTSAGSITAIATDVSGDSESLGLEHDIVDLNSFNGANYGFHIRSLT